MVGSSLTDWTQIQFTGLMLFDIEMGRAVESEGQRHREGAGDKEREGDGAERDRQRQR